jgi:hypothetical protein
MNTRSSGIRSSLLVALLVGLLAVTGANAKGSRGGHAGGRAPRAPRVPAPRQANKAPSFKPPKMPRAAAPARGNAARSQARTNHTQAKTNHAAAATAGSATRRAATGTAGTATSAASAGATRRAATGTAGTATNSAAKTTGNSTNSSSPYSYTYGSGSGARRYRAYGYGQGYRNRYYGGRYGYGRSQGNNRAIVSRLRAVHASLARINHDYQGHRVRAMHSVSMAIRQLSHRSMIYQGAGFASGANNGLAMGRQRGALGGGAGAGGAGGGRRNQAMPQGQSDARMSQALRTLQGVHMQLSNQGSNTTGHSRARGHVQRAIRELNTALAIR